MVGGSKSAKGGPYPLADLDRGGPNPLADMDRGSKSAGGSKSAVTPVLRISLKTTSQLFLQYQYISKRKLMRQKKVIDSLKSFNKFLELQF